MKIEKISIPDSPFETEELRKGLKNFLEFEMILENSFKKKKLGSFKYGIYAFYDYDGEPIYVGQTTERVGTRIRRHLTNQRTDAVAMNVLDPFEVFQIEVWPLEKIEGKIKDSLNTLEYLAYRKLISGSRFKAILNEQEPLQGKVNIKLPKSHRGIIVPEEVRELRGHPDIRMARRALVLSKLAQVISERKVKPGLRMTLLTQAHRLVFLAQQRYEAVKNIEVTDEE